MEVEKQKKNTDMHVRLSEEEKKTIAAACQASGAVASSKARELLITWARLTVSQARTLDHLSQPPPALIQEAA